MNDTRENPALEDFIDELLQDKVFRTRGELAAAIKMTDSGFSRAVRNEGTLSVETCLLLAHAVKESPARILKLAGREALAVALSELTDPRSYQITRRERELLNQWRRIAVSERLAFESLIASYAKRQGVRSGAKVVKKKTSR
jgi:plasmid maintenance system antidote protein VapI